MRVPIKAAALLYPAIVAAAAIRLPRHETPDSVEDISGQREPTILWQNEERSSIKFEVPCPSCFGNDDEQGLVFDLTIQPAERSCGYSDLTLNGQSLRQEWDGIDAWGSGTITTQVSNGPQVLELTADWQSSCLSVDAVPRVDGSNPEGHDVVQILSFAIDRAGEDVVKGISGFTVSFKQLHHPQILRIDSTPTPISHDPSFADPWRSPSPAFRLSPTGGLLPLPLEPYNLESEISTLQDLQAQVSDLKWQVRERKTRIAHLMKQNIHSSIQRCERGIPCIFRTLLDHAPQFFSVMTSHLDHHPPHPMAPPECHDGDSSHPCGPPHVSTSHHGPRPHPHYAPRRRALSHTLHAARAICVAVGITTIITILARKLRKLCSRRSKTERLARREQRRSERAYRHAARRQSWSNWFSRCRRGPSNPHGGDYEEKRALIMAQESVLENSMQLEISALRHAHELVNDLVRAEEGRMSHPISVPGATPAELEAGEGLSFRRTNSLPDYRSEAGWTEPPGYEDELNGEIIVADGFRYMGTGEFTPQGTGSTPGSSVVDCSPRRSVETGRDLAPTPGASVQTFGTGFTKD